MIHILVLGQSNVSSHGRPRAMSDFGRVFHAGKFLPLRDPVPGGSGDGGSVWTRLAPLMRDAKVTSDLVVTVRAQGGTSVADWSENGKCFRALMSDIPQIQGCGVPVTHVVYHQGERDNFLRTDADSYVQRFMLLHRAIADQFPQAEWIVCRASYRMGKTSDAVRQAQSTIIDGLPNCRAGCDTDQFGRDYRYDDTHFNEAGLSAFAAGLLKSFSP
jgi:hypothetical protein